MTPINDEYKICYSVEWLVPAGVAIGGTAYWDALYLDHRGTRQTPDEAIARATFLKAQQHYPQDRLRLRSITYQTIAFAEPPHLAKL